MSHMKLIKLLYLADRQSLLQRGRPITFDRYVSMDRGPVLSKTLDLINYGSPPRGLTYWDTFISPKKHHTVALERQDCPRDDLSEADLAILNEVFEQFGHLNQWQLVRVVHDLPEWKDPKGSALPIGYEEILRLGGRSEDETMEIMEELEAVAEADRIFG